MVPLDCPVPVCFIISSETVCKLLSSININKAIGPDGIPSWILRDHALTLAHPIRTIFNASIREGYLPSGGHETVGGLVQYYSWGPLPNIKLEQLYTHTYVSPVLHI